MDITQQASEYADLAAAINSEYKEGDFYTPVMAKLREEFDIAHPTEFKQLCEYSRFALIVLLTHAPTSYPVVQIGNICHVRKSMHEQLAPELTRMLKCFSPNDTLLAEYIAGNEKMAIKALSHYQPGLGLELLSRMSTDDIVKRNNMKTSAFGELIGGINGRDSHLSVSKDEVLKVIARLSEKQISSYGHHHNPSYERAVLGSYFANASYHSYVAKRDFKRENTPEKAQLAEDKAAIAEAIGQKTTTITLLKIIRAAWTDTHINAATSFLRQRQEAGDPVACRFFEKQAIGQQGYWVTRFGDKVNNIEAIRQ